jgi:hypothetical protein
MHFISTRTIFTLCSGRGERAAVTLSFTIDIVALSNIKTKAAVDVCILKRRDGRTS